MEIIHIHSQISKNYRLEHSIFLTSLKTKVSIIKMQLNSQIRIFCINQDNHRRTKSIKKLKKSGIVEIQKHNTTL
jgi:hypothetical protein